MGEIRAEQRTGVCADPNWEECQESTLFLFWGLAGPVWPKRRLGNVCGRP